MRQVGSRLSQFWSGLSVRRRVALGGAVLGLAGLLALAGQLSRTQLWQDEAVYGGWHSRVHIVTGYCRLIDNTGAIRARGWKGHCTAALTRARAAGEVAPPREHLVLLLHGMGRSPWIFRDLERALDGAGYEAVAVAYPSLTRDLEGHAAHLEGILDGLEGVSRVSFVTHSLGGIVLRTALAREGAWRERVQPGRAVMLAPPSQGSELAAMLGDWQLFHLIGGPSAGQLAAGQLAAGQLTDGKNFAAPPGDVAVGVIAGGREDGEGFNPRLSGDNDGIVTVAEARLKGAADFLVVPAVHTFIASDPETIAATLAFIETGDFR